MGRFQKEWTQIQTRSSTVVIPSAIGVIGMEVIYLYDFVPLEGMIWIVHYITHYKHYLFCSECKRHGAWNFNIKVSLRVLQEAIPLNYILDMNTKIIHHFSHVMLDILCGVVHCAYSHSIHHIGWCRYLSESESFWFFDLWIRIH